MTDFEAVMQAKALNKTVLLARPNVVGLGVGYKSSGKSISAELSIVVLVRQKVPAAALTAEALIPQELAGVRTDVIEVGDLRPFSLRTERWRPAPAGVSLGHYKITAGTLGCAVYDRNSNERLILSNNHVLANRNEAYPGDPILQPGPADGGQVERDTIARLVRFIPLRYNTAPVNCGLARSYALLGNFFARMIGSQHQIQAIRVLPAHGNLLDAAVARPLEDNAILNSSLEIGQINGETTAALGMPVCKSGRTTAYTTGVITVLDATLTVNYGSERAATFEHQFVTSPMSQGGDSGSLLVSCDKHEAVGLLFAGSDQATLYTPIQTVMKELEIEITPKVESKGSIRQAAVERAQAVKHTHQAALLAKANVVGVGVGLIHRNGQRTDQVGLIVMVDEKIPRARLAPEDVLPSEIEGVPVDVREVGRVKALA